MRRQPPPQPPAQRAVSLRTLRTSACGGDVNLFCCTLRILHISFRSPSAQPAAAGGHDRRQSHAPFLTLRREPQFHIANIVYFLYTIEIKSDWRLKTGISQQAWEVRMALTKKAERTKAKLLASARKLIGERGFDQVSVEDITRDSGVAKGTFYHYFKCKEDVVAELSFQSSQTILEESVHFDGTADERCFHYVTALCRDADWAGVRLVRQWIREAMESEEEDSEAKACLYDIYNAIVKICAVRQGRGPGELTEDAPLDTLAKLLMSHVFGALTIWCMMNGSWNLSEQSVKYMEIDIKNLFKPYMIGK